VQPVMADIRQKAISNVINESFRMEALPVVCKSLNSCRHDATYGPGDNRRKDGSRIPISVGSTNVTSGNSGRG